MGNQHPYQQFDETSTGAGAARQTIEDAARAQRRVAGHTRAAAETMLEQAQAAREYLPEPVPEPGRSPAVDFARTAGWQLGSAVRAIRRAVRDIRHKDGRQSTLLQIKSFISRHPSALIGATIAGFASGRALRSR